MEVFARITEGLASEGPEQKTSIILLVDCQQSTVSQRTRRISKRTHSPAANARLVQEGQSLDPTAEQGAGEDKRGGLIRGTKGGPNTKLHAVKDAWWRP